MKSEEAIEIVIHCLGVLAGYEVCEECKIYGDDDLACREVARYAIEALKEVQRYQLIKDVTIGEIAEALKAFSEIGTVEECRKAREKQKPKAPKDELKINPVIDCNGAYVDADTTVYLLCPNCGEMVGIDENVDKFCRECGQAIDNENWRE